MTDQMEEAVIGVFEVIEYSPRLLVTNIKWLQYDLNKDF